MLISVDMSKVLGKLKARKLSEINEACRAQITAGFESNALGALHHYKLDLEDQANLAGTIEATRTTGEPVPFKCRDDQGAKAYRMHTTVQIVQVGLDAYAHKLSTLQTADALQAEIDAATSDTEISTITWPNPD